jgi:hypothetical protein
VELKYFDHHNKKAMSAGGKRKHTSTQKSRKKHKTGLEACPNGDDGDADDDGYKSDGGGDMEGNPEISAANISTSGQGTHRSNLQSSNTKCLPSAVGLTDEEYEFAVMDVYINARSRNICRRAVTDEYFGNKGISTYVHYHKSL